MSNDVEWSKNGFSEGRILKTPDSHQSDVLCPSYWWDTWRESDRIIG